MPHYAHVAAALSDLLKKERNLFGLLQLTKLAGLEVTSVDSYSAEITRLLLALLHVCGCI